jgi:integral membrane protein
MLRIFKLVALLEGISYLLILSNMLFIKPNDVVLYKQLLFPIGMSHGVLFVAYVYLTFANCVSQKWSVIAIIEILLGSLIPFGTFYIERKYLNNGK